MKLLLFSDLHCDEAAARRLVERSQTVDVLIGAGDFGNRRRDVSRCIDILKAAACPAVLVPGNNESVEELRQACRDWPGAHILHGSGVTLFGVTFFGLGGGVPPTPFGEWSYDFTEEEVESLLAACPENGVLVSHSPPQGVVDRASSGRSSGSIAVRNAIIEKGPHLVVCGHIHGSSGQQASLGTTRVINAGPEGIEWELTEDS